MMTASHTLRAGCPLRGSTQPDVCTLADAMDDAASPGMQCRHRI